MIILYLLFIALFIIYADPSILAAKDAVSMFLFNVLPSLLPFFVVSKLLLDSSFPDKMSKIMKPVMKPLFGVSGAGAAALLPGLLCGYPVGAAACAELYGKGKITRSEAEQLSGYTSNTGPFFIVGAVGAAMCHSTGAGMVLLVTHITAGLMVGCIFHVYKKDSGSGHKKPYQIEPAKVEIVKEPFGQKLGIAVTKSVKDVMAVGGFIILFAVIIGIIRETGITTKIGQLIMGNNYKILDGSLCGLVELTTGSSMLASSGHELVNILPFIALILGFGGLSVHAQVIAILNNAGLRSAPFILGKVLQGIISSLLTLAVLRWAPVNNYILNSYTTEPTAIDVFNDMIKKAPVTLINIITIAIAVLLFAFTIKYLKDHLRLRRSS